MKICDLTQSYSDHGGGIQTYIQAKRNYIEKNTDWEHLLIVPGEKDDIIRAGRLTTCTVAAPPVPNCEPYRFIFRLREVLKILRREKPDVIELGSAYNLP